MGIKQSITLRFYKCTNYSYYLLQAYSIPLAFFSNLAHAAIEEGFYDVENLPIRAKSNHEVTAKAIALNNGKRLAFKQVLARFLVTKDFDRLNFDQIKTSRY